MRFGTLCRSFLCLKNGNTLNENSPLSICYSFIYNSPLLNSSCYFVLCIYFYCLSRVKRPLHVLSKRLFDHRNVSGWSSFVLDPPFPKFRNPRRPTFPKLYTCTNYTISFSFVSPVTSTYFNHFSSYHPLHQSVLPSPKTFRHLEMFVDHSPR